MQVVVLGDDEQGKEECYVEVQGGFDIVEVYF